jgi:hypothetical protein
MRMDAGERRGMDPTDRPRAREWIAASYPTGFYQVAIAGGNIGSGEFVLMAHQVIAGDCPDFVFVEFNPRRKSRGAKAARVSVDGDWLWMSKCDIRNNIKEFGPHPELLKALSQYQ